MKTYNALSKEFTDEVKTQMGGGKSIDEAFNAVKNPIDVNGHEYVDLGLPSGTMWATCNVGATKPGDEGLLFQFGRVDGYKYGDENHQFKTDDTPVTTSGKVYKKNDILDLSDDAAHVNMGGSWRMPTKDELQEFIDNTSHEVTIINEVQGMLFISTKPGYEDKQLFIPFIQGFWVNWGNGEWLDRGSYIVYVWSSQVNDSNANAADLLNFNLSGNVAISSSIRSYAYPIRGVFKK